MDTALAARLLALIAEDDRVREELAKDGSLFDGYHPRMEEVHRANAVELRAIIETHGWPTPASCGEEAAEAAWRIAQHAIGEPELQRRVLRLIEAAIARGQLPAWQAAYLEDRIRSLEGRLQRYGTQLDWTDAGELDVYPPVEDPETLEERRRAVGLPPLEAKLRRLRDQGEPRPGDLEERRRRMHEWAIKVGWRRG